MNFRIKTQNGNTYLELPCREKEMNEFCQKIGLPNTTQTQVEVESVSMDDRATNLLAGKVHNLDKLNYLTKRLDSLEKKELTTFYAVAYGEKLENIDSLINLTFNTHCASVVSDFSDLNATGKEMYLTERVAVTPQELKELNGEKYLKTILENNLNPTITPYGIVYKNANEYEQVFDGIHFPAYEWEQNYGCITIGKDKWNEYLYLPYEETELTKALARLSVENIHECNVEIEATLFNDEMKNVCKKYGYDTEEQLNCINHMARRIEDVGLKEMPYISNLMYELQPQTLEDIDAIFDSAYEFELFRGVHSATEYGRYMICESGHFAYDDNLEAYIDFDRYGKQKIREQNGTFTNQGYLVYHGYNGTLSNMLSKVGIEIPMESKQELSIEIPMEPKQELRIGGM